jgi:hypothetical protein
MEDDRYFALLWITARPWFTRVWVVQELAVAQEVTVVCGIWQFSWLEIYCVINFALQYLRLRGLFINSRQRAVRCNNWIGV